MTAPRLAPASHAPPIQLGDPWKSPSPSSAPEDRPALSKSPNKSSAQPTDRIQGRCENRLLLTRTRDLTPIFQGRSPCFLIVPKACLAIAKDLNDLPLPISSLLQEYADVYPDELPRGLPPVRGIEHQIEFVPGASLPNRAAYRASPAETAELQKQVEDLMDKGYVRESLSPCAVPVILVPKKDGIVAHVRRLQGNQPDNCEVPPSHPSP